MSDDGAASAGGREEDSADQSGEEEEEIAEFHPEERFKLRLIKEVEKREPLWNNENKVYSYRTLKEMWREVTSKLHGKDWIKMTAEERQIEVRMTQKTWKNVKDSFIRNVTRRKRGENVKRYCYYGQLRFLLSVKRTVKRSRVLKRESCGDNAEESTPGTSDGRGSKRLYKRFRKDLASNQASPGTGTRDDAPSRQPHNDLASWQKSVGTSTQDDASSSHSGNDPANHRMTTPGTSAGVRCDEPPSASSEFATSVLPAESGRQTMTPLESKLLEIIQVKNKDEPDEDKDFASSLVPMLKKLDDDRKHIAKIKILEAMKNAKYHVQDASVDLPVPDEASSRTPHTDKTQSSQSPKNVDYGLSDESDYDEIGPRK